MRRAILTVVGCLLAILVVGVGALWMLHGLWPGRLRPDTVWAAVAGPKVVALTVDDGPDATYTPRMLEVLARHHVTATFFDVGWEAAKRPGLVRAEMAAGNEVGTHTWSHPRMELTSDAAARDEVARGAEAIRAAAGTPPRFFRPPRGTLTAAEADEAARLGLRVVLWDQSLDNSNDASARAAADRVLARVLPGDIILLHDGLAPRERDVEALDLLLDGLSARGFRVVALSDLRL